MYISGGNTNYNYLFYGLIIFYLAGAALSVIFHKNDRLSSYAAFLSASIASVFGIVFSLYVIFGEKYTLSISGSSFLNFAFVADRLSAFFILSMIFVVTASNAVMFLIVWELMSVISYFLVIYEHEKPETRKAGFIYIVMTHIGTGFIILSFLILTDGSGSFNFDSMSGVSLPPLLKDLVFIFALIGFGTKAGIVPLHIWLPYAHPAAPSNVSALMSG